MVSSCVEPLTLYRPRDPRASDLWRLMDWHFETFQRVYDERFQPKYGFWRAVVEHSVAAFLRCGDLHEGFARVRCPDCRHEMFVAFSCKQRCTCPSCHQKRTLLTALHVAQDVCLPVAHRQVVLTIPKRLRLHTRFDRKLLGGLCACAWKCIQAEFRRLLGRDDVTPGMIAAIQTHGELLHWHPHIHTLVTCGAFTPEGDFLEVPELDIDRLQAAWREAVFALYLAEEKIAPEAVENMRGWPHSGFSVDQSVFLPAHDRPGIERLVQYMTRCPFSLSRLVKVTATGQVVYKAEKDACRAFPDPRGNGLATGIKRNFQVSEPLDFLAEFTQHIPPKGAHLIRYYGWYSNKARGMRRKAAEQAAADDRGLSDTVPSPFGRGARGEGSEERSTSRCSQTWAMLIKRVYEVDPLICPKCGGAMKVIAFIESPQGAVIEKILRGHQSAAMVGGLWHSSTPRAPPIDWGLSDVVPSPFGRGARGEGTADDFADSPPESCDGCDAPGDWTYVDIDTFEAAF